MAGGTLRVFVPTGRIAASPGRKDPDSARTPKSGFVIGLLDNHKHNTDKILDYLEQRLGERYKDARFVRIMKSEAGKAAPASLLDELAADCCAVVNGIGD